MLKSVLSRLKGSLARTRSSFVSGLRSIVRGRALDDALIAQIESALLKADVGVGATGILIESIRRARAEGRLTRGDDVLEHLKRRIKALWPDEQRGLNLAETGTSVILVTGINGSGKTTTIAKLARLLGDQGHSVLLGACDTFRAGAVRQLEIWAQRLGVAIVKGQEGGDPAAVAFDACAAGRTRGVDVVILDTAGRLHTQDPLMRQLAKIRSVAGKRIDGAPHEVLLVIDATAGQNGLRQAREFTGALGGEDGPGVTGIVLSKLDGTAKGGIVVAIKGETDIPVKFVGVGERPEDLEAFDPETFVEALFAE